MRVSHAVATPMRPDDRRGQQTGNLPQFCADTANSRCGIIQPLAGVAGGQGQIRLRIHSTAALIESVSSTAECVALAMNQPLDFESQLHIAPAVKPLSGSTLVGFQLRKLRFPKAQNVAFDRTNTGHIPNLEIEAVGNRRRVKGTLRG